MANRRLLIIDDEPLIRDTLSEYLEQEGFAVTVANALADTNRQANAIADVKDVTGRRTRIIDAPYRHERIRRRGSIMLTVPV